MSTTSAYAQLSALQQRLHRLGHLQSLAGWDQSVNMPAGGNDARSLAMAEMAGLLHRLRTEPQLEGLIAQAHSDTLNDDERANLREIRREWVAANALPESLVEANVLATSRCEHAWRSQRPANDWAGLLPNLREVVHLARDAATRLGERQGLSRYDALMERFEPGMRSQQVDAMFGDVATWLPGLIRDTLERQASAPTVEPTGPFDLTAQRRLCEAVVARLGFDLNAGRLDVSTHPFCGGVPEDVRMTTRYREDDFLGALMGTVHETGHGRYEQNRPREWLDQPLSQARSMAVHESQSLSFEMQLGGHPGFAAMLAPLVRSHLGAQDAFTPDNLRRLITRVKPGLIRVDADEVTYPAHIILRYQIERALIEGEIEVEDIPALWDEKMQAMLGLDTRGNFKDGPMQDVHWPVGLFGYFPCYSLGAMYAAQWFAAMRRSQPTLDASLDAGDFSPMFDWLRSQVWSQGSRWTTAELVQRATGEALNPAYFQAHLRRRYLGA